MIRAISRISVIVGVLRLAPVNAQQLDKPATTAPRLLRLNGFFHPANGLPVGPTEGATLSIYREEQGGVPLWQETQNVNLDGNGHFTAMLGITQKDGVPLDLFSPELRWLGVQFNRSGEVEQPRVQLVSVPYALKAVDAETLAGRPASAYLLSATAGRADSEGDGGTTALGSALDVAGDISLGSDIRYQGDPVFQLHPALGPPGGIGALQNRSLKMTSKSALILSPMPLTVRLRR